MAGHTDTRIKLGASLFASAGLAVSVLAQEAPPAEHPAAAPVTASQSPDSSPKADAASVHAGDPPEGQPVAAAPAPESASTAAATQPVASPPPGTKPISFSFKDAPIDQVLDFFARESGVPVIFEAPSPAGTISFVSAGDYSFDEALSILNLNLQRFGVHLRKQDQFLYLATLQDSMKKPMPVASPGELTTAPPDLIVTVSLPLDNARAETVAEQIKGLVGPFGGVISVPAQNMVVVVETAAQVRRIREIVNAIDSVRPVDSAFRLFPLVHAQADAVLGALRGLVGERVTTVIVDKDGQKRTLQEQQVTGVQLAADPRTNSIIAVGSSARIKTVEDLIRLLDTPESSGENQMLTYTLSAITPEAAVAQVNALFASLDPKKRPTVIPIPESGKVTLVGPGPLLAQAGGLLSQIDPAIVKAGEPSATPERRTLTARLKHATPQQVEGLLTRLSTPRQLQVVKFAPAPDGKGIIIAGPASDVAAFEAIISAVDAPAENDQDVRLIRLNAVEPEKVLARTQSLYQATGKAELKPISATLERETGTLTLIGSRDALTEFGRLLNSAEAAAGVALETRRFSLKKSSPSGVAERLSRLARSLLAPADGSVYIEPQIDAADDIATLVVRALPAHFEVLSSLIEQLDGTDLGGTDVRVIRLSGSNPAATLERARLIYAQRITGVPPALAGAVKAELDPASGAVVISGRPEGVRLFTDTLTQAQQLSPPLRTTRLLDVHNVTAAAILPPLLELLKSADSIDPARRVPDPTIQAVERTNSLLVTAEEAQQQLIAEYVARLDKLEQTNPPPLKLLQLRTAESAAIAAMLVDQYGKRPQAERAAKPVEVRSDAATNTLIVSAHPDVFAEIKTFVEEIDKEKNQAKRLTEIFPLKVAKAADVAAAMDRLYPEPPIPTDRLGRPQPWLKQPREVLVSAELGSNAIIIDAPAERMESLRELAGKLDRVELPPAAALRTWRITGPSLDAVAKTLQSMSARGILSAPAQPGKQPVQVVIETEPKSGTLIVAGDDRTFETVETVLKELSLVPVEKGLRIVPIANQKAASVRERALAIYEAQIRQVPNANPIDITIDEATNSLMVVADAEAMERFSKVMNELERQSGPAREVRLIELKLAKADDVVEFLSDLVKSSESLMIRGGPEPLFEAIEATNTILVAAQPGQLAVIDALIKTLDSRQEADKPPMRILRLRSTDAQNLAGVLQREYDKRPIEQRGRQPVSIEADAGTNTLIVSAHSELLPEIEAIVSQLNETDAVGAEGREIRIFPLRIARAEELALTIDQMYPEPPVPLDPRTRQPRPDLKPVREIVVRADRATNSLIVDAPAKRLAGFEQIVKSLDQTKVADDVELRTYRVQRADANATAATLRGLAASGSLGNSGEAASSPVTVNVDAPTRTLIISGPSAIFAAVEDVLNKVDAPPEVPESDLKLYPLAKARADRMAPIVQRLLAARAKELVLVRSRSVTDENSLVEVAADAASNTLIVSAPRELLPVADGIIKSLDAESVATATRVRVFRLGKGSALTVAPAISAAVKAQAAPGETDATVTPEPASNTIVIVGTEAQLERSAALIESMDVAVDQEGLGVRSITLKHARAESLAPVLEQVLAKESALDKLPEWARMQAIARGAEERPRVRVAAEPRMNALLVSGPQAVLDLAEQVVLSLDVEPTAGAAVRGVRIITLRNADAAELAVNLEAVFKDARDNLPAPVIRVDSQSNSLLIRAAPEQMATVDELVSKLDSASVGATRHLRMVPVDKARVDAEILARTLQRLLEQQGGAKIEVISTEELLNRQGAPKKRSGITPAGGSSLPGLHGMVAFMAIGVSHPAPAGQPAPEDGTDLDGSIAVDPATNSIMLLGSPRFTERVARLAEVLQKQIPAEPVGVRVITLPSSLEASSVAQIVNQTIQQMGRTGPDNPGGFSGPVSVTADPAGSALIVLANDTDFSTVGSLITTVMQLDAAPQITLKVYPLANITAQRAVQGVRDLLSTEPRGAQARRLRAVELTLPGIEGDLTARIDPASVRMTPDATGGSIFVAAPAQAFPLIDRLIETLDQSPVRDRLAIRRYELRHAQAADLARVFQSAFDAQRQGQNAPDTPATRFIADERTNTLLVTAGGAQHEEIVNLLATADQAQQDPSTELAFLTLQVATPSAVQRIVEEVVIGRDPAKRQRLFLSAQDASSVFVVRGSKEDVEQVRALVAQVDSAESSGLPVRSIKLERADAAVVAVTLQKFFADRAAVSTRPGQRAVNRVAVTGDKRTGTIIVCAGDDDFAQVESLVKTFDSPTPTQDFQFKILPLKNARVSDIGDTIKNMMDEVRWTSMFSARQGQGDEHQLFVELNDATNSIILMGRGEQIQVVEKVLSSLDQEPPQRAIMAIKSVEVRNADLSAVRNVLERAFSTPGWRSWRGPDPAAITVQVDRQRRAIIVVGKGEQVEKALAYVKELDTGPGGEDRAIEALPLTHARADRAAQNLRQFFSDRARAQGVDQPSVSVIGSPDGNVILASAGENDMLILRDLLAQIDQPDAGKDRRVEVFVLRNGVARDTADVLRSMFARSEGGGQERINVTPQPSTNSVIISAPESMFDEVAALLRQLDAPPTIEDANIETVALTTARAQEVAQAVRAALPPNVKVTVTPVTRSNSLMLTGSKEAIALVMDQVRKIDTEPVRSGQVFRRYRLTAADASEVARTLDDILRSRPRAATDPEATVDASRQDNTLTIYAPAGEIDEIEKIIKELDLPAVENRRTEFVKLEYANAEQTAAALKVFYGRYASEAADPAARTVTILPDPLSNSLVIRADEQQWTGIRALLSKLDTQEYDTKRQLAVIALSHGDAVSIARALNDGLRAPLEEQLRQAQARNQAARGANRPIPEATVLVDSEGVPTVSAEPQTNSLVVFAGRRELDRIQEIVRQLDVSGFAGMPQARIIALKNGKPSTVAQTIRDLFLGRVERGAQPPSGPRSVMVIGDDASGALIVRADDEKFAQIKALAQTLEEQGQAGRVMPHVLRLRHTAAVRLRPTLLAAFTETARQQGETFAVEVDRTGNALIVACSERLLVEVKRIIEELDTQGVGGTPQGANPVTGMHQSVLVVEIVNNNPADIRKVLEDIGITRPQTPDRPGIVSEPVSVVVMSSRKALAVVAAPADITIIESLIKTLDSAPVDSTQVVAVLPLKMATARPLVDTLAGMLSPTSQTVEFGHAKAVAEHVRRLGISKSGVDQSAVQLDLTKPIRLIADVESNAVVLASTQANIDALREVVKLLDTLPVGDAVIVRIFTLQNASAQRVKQVVDQLFSQGESLRRLPGTRRQGLPPTATGQALAGEIVVSVDERTNTLVVAGREEGVALVEVLVKDLDSDRAANWIEPAILPLQHADAAQLARKLQEVLVRGLALTPEAIGLQKQYGRLRFNAAGVNFDPADKASMIQADLFAPITGLVITAEEQLNALLVVGTPANLQVVRALVAQLDVEAASAANTVRVFPLAYAASDRVASLLREMFRQRESLPDQRPEDRVIISSDARTNSLIVATSPKSFAMIEGMLKTLDGEKSNFSVGLHVIPVLGSDVRQLAPRIDRLMKERIAAAAAGGGLRDPRDAFSIEPEPISNLLIVACSEENLVIVKELVSALSTDAAKVAAGERVEMVQLGKARATDIAASVNSLYVEKEVSKRGPGSVSVTPNERLNALVVSGNEQDIIEIRALAGKLDTAEVAMRQVIHWIELKSANATEVVALIESVIAGRPVGGGRSVGARQATKVQFLRDQIVSELGAVNGRKPTEAEIDGAIRDQVTLTADARTNSIWITAPEAMVRLISEMIEDIERSSAGSRKIERFTLINADAGQMAELLRDTFRLEQRGNAMVLLPTGRRSAIDGPGSPDGAGGMDTTVTAVPDERQQLSIAVDRRTNTLIVSGTEEYLSLVRQVIADLDGISANERERRVYNLRNAKAKEIETTLRSYFRSDADAERTTLGPQLSGSLMRRLEQEVTIVGDEKSNKLVISTSPRYMQTVISIVNELDTPPPQVMIQVLLAEVTVDSSEQWGMDFTVGPFGGDGTKIGFLGGGSGVATALGVPNLSVSSADFGILIRSLEAQGKLEILSNPQVTVNNNQPAKINVGEEIGIAGDTQFNNFGNLISSVERIPVGIIMNVTPSISDDGFVRMDINPEISQLTNKTTQINRDQTAPIIARRSVDTVVTVKDGQSVVIGGLIQTTQEERRTKMPIIGDIPLLGLPFTTKQQEAKKTELLVIVTPRVIPNLPGTVHGMVEEVTQQSVDRLEDPTRILDYLERVKEDIKALKARSTPAPEPTSTIPPPDPVYPEYVLPPATEPR